MYGKCRLFEMDGDLKHSHIYPAFVVDYMKKTGSRYLRTQTNPNLRQQDGLKMYLLSEKAEQLFSSREKWFAENVFIPYMEQGARSFLYDENLYYFSLSFLWRILVLHTDFTPQIRNHWVYPTLLDVEKEWQHFLSSYRYPITHNKIQLFFTDRVKNIPKDVKGIDYYTSRALDGTIVTTPDKSYVAVYGKFLRFIFWIVIKSNRPHENPDALIQPTSGNISIPQKIQDDYLSDFIVNRSNEFSQIGKLSPKQEQRIIGEVVKDKEGFWNSDAGRAIYNDMFRFNNNEDNV